MVCSFQVGRANKVSLHTNKYALSNTKGSAFAIFTIQIIIHTIKEVLNDRRFAQIN